MSGVLPLALMALKWLWIKISIWHHFRPDFITPIKTLLFKSIRENVNSVAPWENWGVVITVIIAAAVCSSLAKLLLKLFPWALGFPDTVTAAIGILGFIVAAVWLCRFVSRNRLKQK
jgi:hypothetical protein